MAQRQSDRPAVAIVIMVVAVAMLVGMNTVVKIIGPDYHAFQVTFLRNAVAAVVLMPFVLRAGGMNALRTRRPGMQLVRSLSGLTGVCCFFYAVQHMAIGDVMVLSQAVPLFVTALAVPLLKEKVGWRRTCAVMAGFAGVIIALGPVSNISFAAMMAVLGTALWAVTILSVRSLGATDSPEATTFYYMVFGTVVGGLIQPWVWQTPPAELWPLFIGAGVLGAIAQLLIAYSLKIGEASVVSPFNYTAIVWAMIVDFAIWSVYPSFWTVAGAVVITIAGLYIFHREGRPVKDTP